MKLLSFIGSLLIIGTASAADIKIYYSPTCPHCHHAIEFFTEELVYELDSINIEKINLTNEENVPLYTEAMKKCNLDGRGVPLIVVGEKCFYGYAPNNNDEIREAAMIGLSDADKAKVEANITKLKANSEEFKKAHADRIKLIKERKNNTQKKTDDQQLTYLWILMGLLIIGLGFVLTKKKK